MKICFFGTYENGYPLNSIIIKGLKKNDINVVECHEPLWEKYRNKHGNFIKLFSLLKFSFGIMLSYLKLCFKYSSKCKNVDVIVVGYIGQLDIIFLKLLTLFKKKKPKIVFIPLVSLYDTAIIDRGLSKKSNFFAKVLFFIDKYSFKIADLVLFDTNEHINYICDTFKLNKDKFKRIWVGADEDIFYPIYNDKKNNKNIFKILFIGKYIPLHGIKYIIKAAKLLENEEDIRFKIIGSGQLNEEITKLRKELTIRNIDFVDWIDYNKLVNEINNTDVILGIFGGTQKSLRVIPNKVFQSVACKKAVITGDTIAIRELFKDKENIYLCENRNPESLKNAILTLKNDEKLKEKIAYNSYNIFQRELNTRAIGKEILKIINEL
ncbi:MAG: glycosyltransferase [Patescibacteria group bacterium]|nr:glycosyltransferase [Patescibacteria group bacterium]